MNILYFLIIKPIEAVLGFLFSTYVHLTGSYGLSIMLLSLSVTIIMFPLFYIAEVWKRKEQAVEKRMKKRLSYIKKYYTGQKRYCMIKATHRLEGYTAASSFRTSFGLLIQIPFFFAAYHLLSHYEPYRGVGWLFIRDFAVPDGLLWGLNLLPIAMTVINIVSSSIYMRGSRARDIIELYVMAGVFLVLLYASPAALVLYWTMNNVFSVGKSLIFLRLFPHEKYVPDPEDKSFKDYVQGIRDAVKPCLTPDFYAFAVVAVLFGLQCRFFHLQRRSFTKLFLIICAFAVILAFVTLICWLKKYIRKEENRITLAKIMVTGFLFVAVSATGLFSQSQGLYDGFLKKLFFLATFFADILIYVCLDILISWRSVKDDCKPDIAVCKLDSLYYWNILFLALSVTILWPVLVFLSSPADAETSIWSIFQSNIPVLVVLGVLSFVCFRSAGKESRSKLAALMLFLSILVILYHYILPCDYGELDKAMLGLNKKLDNKSIFPWIADITVIVSAMLMAKVCVRRYLVQSRNAISVILICMVGLTGIRMVNYFKSDAAQIVEKPSIIATLPRNNDVLNGYSKNGKNIVLFISDQFNGGYLENILKDHPEYKTSYSGFTWYKNAVSLANYTCGSIPSLFAGEDYSPAELNKMKGNGYAKIMESASIMFNSFTSDKYKVSILGGSSSYLRSPRFKKINYSEKNPYGRYFKQNYMTPDQEVNIPSGPLFIMLSLFQNSPYFLKPIIYDGAGWLIFSDIVLYGATAGTVETEYGFVKLLPEISNTNETGNTFKYIHSTLTHRPWCIKKDGSVVKPGEFSDETARSFWTGNAAYYTCSGFIALFMDYINWLKSNGVYDNTYIILVSDHGNDYPEHNPFIKERDFSRLNALFMVKPFNSIGDLRIDSNTLISLQDIPAFLKNAKDGTPIVIQKDRKLYPVYFIHVNNFLKTGELDITRSFELTDNIYDEKNWKEIK